MGSDLDRLKQDWLDRIAGAADLAALEEARVAALGKQGAITALLKTLGGLSPEERQNEGPRIHGLREAVTGALAARKAALEDAALEQRLASERLDMTLPAAPVAEGSVHPVSQVMDERAEIFADLGFSVATGPEIEDDWHNFTALNIPETHPARAMHDTFYFPDKDAEGRARFGPPGQPGDGRAGGNLRRHGLRRRHRPGNRGRLAQLHRAQHARKPPGAGDARHVLLPAGRCE